MNEMGSLIAMRGQQYCMRKESEQDRQALEICSSASRGKEYVENLRASLKYGDVVSNKQSENDRRPNKVYVRELRRECFIAAKDMLYENTIVPIEDAQRIKRYFTALREKNQLLLIFYERYEESPLAIILDAEDEIKTLKEEQQILTSFIKNCEERIEAMMDEKTKKTAE